MLTRLRRRNDMTKLSIEGSRIEEGGMFLCNNLVNKRRVTGMFACWIEYWHIWKLGVA